MADEKRTTENGKHEERRVAEQRNEQQRTDDRRATDHRADKSAQPHGEKEDLTPTPTQAQLDERAGEVGKTEKAEREKVAASRKQEDLTPTPTQAEADEVRAKAFGMTVEEAKKQQQAYVDAHTPKAAKEGEDLTPTPTQAELDDVKRGVMYQPEDNPGGGTDPQKAGQAQRRTIEPTRPGGGYETRAMAKAE